LILSERLPTRSQLASLLFTEAGDPLRALRWSLSEIRRCLGEEGSLDGDPVVLHLAGDAMVDVEVVAHGSWIDAVGLPGLGADLLEGIAAGDRAAFCVPARPDQSSLLRVPNGWAHCPVPASRLLAG
jgi:hypothetical protein